MPRISICKVCDAKFEAPNTMGRATAYCSKACWREHRLAWDKNRRTRVAERACRSCGDQFHPKHGTELYCSKDCAADGFKALQKKRRPPKKRACIVCHVDITGATPAAKTCSPQCSHKNLLVLRKKHRNTPKARQRNRRYYNTHCKTVEFKIAASLRGRNWRNRQPEVIARRAEREALRPLRAARAKEKGAIQYALHRETALAYSKRRHKRRIEQSQPLQGVYKFFRSIGVVPQISGSLARARLGKIALKEAIQNGFPVPNEVLSATGVSNYAKA